MKGLDDTVGFSQKKPRDFLSFNPKAIKAQINPVDFYRHELPGVALKRVEWNDGGLCPFHQDNTPGSFRINLTTGAYKCFACGAVGGDILAFVMALYGLSFASALQKLADEWRVLS